MGEPFGICNKGETATFSRGSKTFGSPFIYVGVDFNFKRQLVDSSIEKSTS